MCALGSFELVELSNDQYMNVGVKASNKALERLGFKGGRPPEKSRVKKIQDKVGETGSSMTALEKMLDKCRQDTNADCSIDDVRKIRKMRKKQEHVDRINKHYKALAQRNVKASKPKLRRVVTDVTRKKR